MVVSTLLRVATVGLEPKALERKSYCLGRKAGNRTGIGNFAQDLGSQNLKDIRSRRNHRRLFVPPAGQGNVLTSVVLKLCTEPWEPQ